MSSPLELIPYGMLEHEQHEMTQSLITGTGSSAISEDPNANHGIAPQESPKFATTYDCIQISDMDMASAVNDIDTCIGHAQNPKKRWRVKDGRK